MNCDRLHPIIGLAWINDNLFGSSTCVFTITILEAKAKRVTSKRNNLSYNNHLDLGKILRFILLVNRGGLGTRGEVGHGLNMFPNSHATKNHDMFSMNKLLVK